MIQELMIEVENRKLSEMDIEQPIQYRPLRFRVRALVGYWVSTEAIVVYVGVQTFNAKITSHNIAMLETILNES